MVIFNGAKKCKIRLFSKKNEEYSHICLRIRNKRRELDPFFSNESFWTGKIGIDKQIVMPV